MEIYNAALIAVDPYTAVTRAVRIENSYFYVAEAAYELDAYSHILVVGAGKATARMALAMEDALGERIAEGLIIVKKGHTAGLRIIKQIEAGHPLPDEAGVQGTERILELVQRADAKTLVICLLSGGGSSLLAAPLPGVTLEDKQRTTELLLRAGATIDELNAVRKHLSAVKGGRLAQIAHPATVVTLILSDVIGDRLEVIASGPTASDTSTFADAAQVIEKYGINHSAASSEVLRTLLDSDYAASGEFNPENRLKTAVPSQVILFLERGKSGQEPETVKSGAVCFLSTRNVIVGGLAQALAAAREKAASLGWRAEVVTAELQGEARDAARLLARKALQTRDELGPGERRCLLYGGETTVTVMGNGKGGRNQELALAFAVEIAGMSGITLLSAGTDGTDGPTDAAGAVVDGSVVNKAREFGIHPEVYLGNNDSYTFFERLDSHTNEKRHLMTGPTGTNVMDIQIMLIER